MIYLIGASSAVASGTELGVAFVMGATGTFTWIYLLGAVDFRLTTLILATSLIGVQIGAVGTTYVRQYYIKMAMATVMLLVTLSRALAVPGYLVELGWIEMDESVVGLLNAFVLPVMTVAFLSSTPIVLYTMLSIRNSLAKAGLLEKSLDGVHVGRFNWRRIGVFGLLTALNYYILFHDPEWWPRFVTSIPYQDPLTAIALTLGVILYTIYWSFVHGNFAYGLLDFIKIAPLKKEVSAIVAQHGRSGLEEWIDSMSDKFEKERWPLW